MQHLESRPFQCHLCDKTYKLNYMLKDHIESVHQVSVLEDLFFVAAFTQAGVQLKQ